jgi:hypothetical protein
MLFKIQEVQFKNPNHFEMHYLPHFTSLGYSAAMKSRTGDKEDGCVIFYKGMNTLVLSINVSFLISDSVVDPEPNPDPYAPYVFDSPGSSSGSFYHQAELVRKTLNSVAL